MSGLWEPGGDMFEVVARFMAEGRRWADARKAYVGAGTSFATVLRDFADVLEGNPDEAERWKGKATPETLRKSAETIEQLTADERDAYLDAAALEEEMRGFMERNG